MDDPNKEKTRALGGIPALVKLLNHDCPDVYRNACGALRYLLLKYLSKFEKFKNFFFKEIYHTEDKMMKINELLKMLEVYRY